MVGYQNMSHWVTVIISSWSAYTCQRANQLCAGTVIISIDLGSRQSIAPDRYNIPGKQTRWQPGLLLKQGTWSASARSLRLQKHRTNAVKFRAWQRPCKHKLIYMFHSARKTQPDTADLNRRQIQHRRTTLQGTHICRTQLWWPCRTSAAAPQVLGRGTWELVSPKATSSAALKEM